MSTSENTAHTLEPSPSAPAAKHHGLVSRARAALPYGAATLVGLAIGALVFAPHTPAQLEAAPQSGSVPVVEQPLTDSRTVELVVTSSAAQPIRFAGSGTLTSVTCPEENILRSGTSTFAVDGQNVVPLATSVPLWRDLHEGDTGEDVRALQAELSRLGYSVGVDGILG